MKIYLANAYNQIRLGTKRRLVPSIHRGVLLKNVLSFGNNSAPGYFQEILDEITKDQSGVAIYLDDLLVGRSTAEEHV